MGLFDRKKVDIPEGKADVIETVKKEDSQAKKTETDTVSRVDELIAMHSSSIDEQKQPETNTETSVNSEGVVAEEVDIKIGVKGATRKRGSKRKSKSIEIPAETAVKIGSIFLSKLFVFVLKTLLKKNCEDSDFDISEGEIDTIAPMAEVLIAKYLEGYSTEIILAYTLGAIYGGRIMGVMSDSQTVSQNGK